jgi:hypothetical protein
MRPELRVARRHELRGKPQRDKGLRGDEAEFIHSAGIRGKAVDADPAFEVRERFRELCFKATEELRFQGPGVRGRGSGVGSG